MKKCLVCGAESEGKFCSECGAKMPEMRVCPNCGAKTDRKFCSECGTKVVADVTSEKEGMSDGTINGTDEYGDDEYGDSDTLEDDGLTDEEILQDAKNYDTSQCKTIAYEKLARNPDKYQLETIKISGRVVQTMEDGTNYCQLRVAVNDNYDTVMYVEYDNRILESRILEDDYITLYGTSAGTITYESTLGGNITIPAMLADKIVFN